MSLVSDKSTNIIASWDIQSSPIYISSDGTPNACIYDYDYKEEYTISSSCHLFKKPFNWEIKKIIVDGPATIIFWGDGTKSVVKCQDDEKFDLEKGIAMCFVRKALGNENKYHKHIRKAVKMAEDYIEEQESVTQKVNIEQAMDIFAAEVNRAINNLFKGEKR